MMLALLGFADWVEWLQWLLPIQKSRRWEREREREHLKEFQLMLIMLALRCAAPANGWVELLQLLVESGS